MTTINFARNTHGRYFGWEPMGESTFVCRVKLIEDKEQGGFTAIASRLPGVVSEGETIEEAIENLKEAFVAVVAEYNKMGIPVPFTDEDLQISGICRNILVHVE